MFHPLCLCLFIYWQLLGFDRHFFTAIVLFSVVTSLIQILSANVQCTHVTIGRYKDWLLVNDDLLYSPSWWSFFQWWNSAIVWPVCVGCWSGNILLSAFLSVGFFHVRYYNVSMPVVGSGCCYDSSFIALISSTVSYFLHVIHPLRNNRSVIWYFSPKVTWLVGTLLLLLLLSFLIIVVSIMMWCCYPSLFYGSFDDANVCGRSLLLDDVLS